MGLKWQTSLTGRKHRFASVWGWEICVSEKSWALVCWDHQVRQWRDKKAPLHLYQPAWRTVGAGFKLSMKRLIVARPDMIRQVARATRVALKGLFALAFTAGSCNRITTGKARVHCSTCWNHGNTSSKHMSHWPIERIQSLTVGLELSRCCKTPGIFEGTCNVVLSLLKSRLLSGHLELLYLHHMLQVPSKVGELPRLSGGCWMPNLICSYPFLFLFCD